MLLPAGAGAHFPIKWGLSALSLGYLNRAPELVVPGGVSYLPPVMTHPVKLIWERRSWHIELQS